MILSVILLIAIGSTDLAATDLSVNIDINYDTNIVTVSGNVTGYASWVTLSVEGPAKKLEYIGSTTVGNSGYSISFGLADPINEGTYKLKIKAEGLEMLVTTEFVYWNGTGISANSGEISTNTVIAESITNLGQEDIYKLCPKYDDNYTITITSGFSFKVYEQQLNSLTPLVYNEEIKLTYPKIYYVKIWKSTAGTGSYEFTVSNNENRNIEKAFVVTIGENDYYSNLSDNSYLYKDNIKIGTGTKATWLVYTGTLIFFAGDDGLYKLDTSASEPICVLSDVKPAYITTDGYNVYYSDLNANSQIYKYTPSGDKTLICTDTAAWLHYSSGNIYYLNGRDGRTPYYVNVNYSNVSGDPVE